MSEKFKELMLAVGGPDANVVVGGELIQGEMTPMMAAMLEARQKIRELGDDATEKQVDALLNPFLKNARLDPFLNYDHEVDHDAPQ